MKNRIFFRFKYFFRCCHCHHFSVNALCHNTAACFLCDYPRWHRRVKSSFYIGSPHRRAPKTRIFACWCALCYVCALTHIACCTNECCVALLYFLLQSNYNNCIEFAPLLEIGNGSNKRAYHMNVLKQHSKIDRCPKRATHVRLGSFAAGFVCAQILT